MKPLFGGLVLIFIFLLNEVDTAEKLGKLKTKYTATATEPDDKVRKDDNSKSLVLGTPALPKKPHAPSGPRYSDFLSEPDRPDKTGEEAHKLFLKYYQAKGLPNTSKATLDLYAARHAGGSYHSPEEQGVSMNQRFKEARRRAGENLLQPHHQQMYQQHQDFQDHSEGSELNTIGTHAHPRNPRGPPKKSRASHGPYFSDFLVKPDLPDKTGENAHKLFLTHYQEKGLPNTPKESLDLYNERHAGGSYHLPEEQGASITQRYDEARKRAAEPLVQQHHQQMYQQYQGSQDPSGDSRLSSRGSDHRNENQHNVGDQPSGSGLSSGNNYPYTAPPRTPSEDLCAHFDIQPPEHLDFEQISSQNNPSATSLIDNYNINLRRKYGDHSRDSGAD